MLRGPRSKGHVMPRLSAPRPLTRARSRSCDIGRPAAMRWPAASGATATACPSSVSLVRRAVRWNARTWPRGTAGNASRWIAPASGLRPFSRDVESQTERTTSRRCRRIGTGGSTSWTSAGRRTSAWATRRSSYLGAMVHYLAESLPRIDFQWLAGADHFCGEHRDKRFAACRPQVGWHLRRRRVRWPAVGRGRCQPRHSAGSGRP